MIEEQDSLCRLILQNLRKYPIAEMFDDCSGSEIAEADFTPLSFKIIENKLDKHFYQNADEWVAEMRIFLSNEIEYQHEDIIKKSAAKQLLLEFEKLMSSYSPSLSPHIAKLQLNEAELTEICRTMKFFSENKPKGIAKDSASYYMKEIRNEKPSPAQLVHLIKLAKSPNNLIKILAYAYHLQPECVSFGEKTYIKLELMSQESLNNLANFIDNLICDCVSRKIDPFERFSCYVIEPADVVMC